MLFENEVKENKNAFLRKVKEIAKELQFNPDWLMYVMHHESRFNHRIVNGIGCVGLIQFCPNGGLTASGLSSQQMASLSNVEQLEYVKRFFLPIKGQAKNFADVHLYAFVPSSFSQRNNRAHVIGSEVGQAKLYADINKGFDFNRDGLITIGDFQDYTADHLQKYGNTDYKPQTASFSPLALPTFDNFKTLFKNPYFITGIVVILFLLFFNPFKRT